MQGSNSLFNGFVDNETIDPFDAFNESLIRKEDSAF